MHNTFATPTPTTHHRLLAIVAGTLAGGDQQLVRMDGQALDVVGVANVVALRLLVDVVQHDDGGNEVGHLAGRQLVQIAATVFAAVAVHPVELQLLAGRRLDAAEFVRIANVAGRVQHNGAAAQEQLNGAVLLVVGARAGAGAENATLERLAEAFGCDSCYVHKVMVCVVVHFVQRENQWSNVC